VNDDWRIELDVEDHDVFHRALDRLRERGVARDARARLADDVVISVSAERIYAYVPTPERAQETAGVLTELAAEHHLTVDTTIARWDAGEEQWIPVDRTT
jgi:hypothetical protein